MIRRTAVLLLFVTIGFAAGMVLTGAMRNADTANAAPQAEATQATPARPIAGAPPGAQSLPDLTGIAERAVSAVTSITSTSIIQNPFARDPVYRFLYGDQLMDRQAQSLGSGVIVSRDGYVVTNNHVIASGSDRPQVSVILADKREFNAKIIGTDPQSDLAILKIEATNLPTIPWGDSARIRVAEWVLAIGNPFGVFSQTVTLGIVSATGRSVEGLSSYEEFIQTDAAINRGNSGGALINARGELVGINTAIYSETGGYQGIGLAVPSNLVRSTMDQLIKDGMVRRGTILGIRLQQLTPQIASELGVADTKGVLIVRVDTRSDAYAAGLRSGDVITAINGTTLEGPQSFLRLLADAKIGSTATLTLVREGRKATAQVTIDEQRPTQQRVR